MTLKGFEGCETCGGAGKLHANTPLESGDRCAWCLSPDHLCVCPSCLGVGVVPDPETVEVCKQAYQEAYWRTYDGPVRSMAQYEATSAALLAYAQQVKETE